MVTKKNKKTVAKVKRGRQKIPVYAYTKKGVFEGAYPSVLEFGEEHGVTRTGVIKAIQRAGVIAGLQVRREKTRSLPPIIEKEKAAPRSKGGVRYNAIPVYAYTRDGAFVEGYSSVRAFAMKHGVTPTSVSKALLRNGSTVKLQVRREKLPSIPPVQKRLYTLLPDFPIYVYDKRCNAKGVVTLEDWKAFTPSLRKILAHIFKTRKTKGYGGLYYSTIKGREAFTGKAMKGKTSALTKGGVIVTFPNGKERLYAQASDAAKDLGVWEERISEVLHGKRELVNGYRFRSFK